MDHDASNNSTKCDLKVDIHLVERYRLFPEP